MAGVVGAILQSVNKQSYCVLFSYQVAQLIMELAYAFHAMRNKLVLCDTGGQA